MLLSDATHIIACFAAYTNRSGRAHARQPEQTCTSLSLLSSRKATKPSLASVQVYVRDWQKFFERAVAAVTFTSPLDPALPSTPRSLPQRYSHPSMTHAVNTPRVLTKLSPKPKLLRKSRVLSVTPGRTSRVLKIKPRLVTKSRVFEVAPSGHAKARLVRQPQLVPASPALVPGLVSDASAKALRFGVQAIELNNLGRLDESAALLRKAIALAPDAVSIGVGVQRDERFLA